MSANKEQRNKRTADPKKKDSRDTELAAEIAHAPPPNEHARTANEATEYDESEARTAANRSLGWIALALSIASLFVLPQWFGLAGIVLGGAAWFIGVRGLGLWSIVIGTISLISYVVLVPYYS